MSNDSRPPGTDDLTVCFRFLSTITFLRFQRSGQAAVTGDFFPSTPRYLPSFLHFLSRRDFSAFPLLIDLSSSFKLCWNYKLDKKGKTTRKACTRKSVFRGCTIKKREALGTRVSAARGLVLLVNDSSAFRLPFQAGVFSILLSHCVALRAYCYSSSVLSAYEIVQCVSPNL